MSHVTLRCTRRWARCKICKGKVYQWLEDDGTPINYRWFHETVDARDTPFDIIDWLDDDSERHDGEPAKWRLERITHTQRIKGIPIYTNRWWLTHPIDFRAEAVGTYEECVAALVYALKHGPQHVKGLSFES